MADQFLQSTINHAHIQRYGRLIKFEVSSCGRMITRTSLHLENVPTHVIGVSQLCSPLQPPVQQTLGSCCRYEFIPPFSQDVGDWNVGMAPLIGSDVDMIGYFMQYKNILACLWVRLVDQDSQWRYPMGINAARMFISRAKIIRNRRSLDVIDIAQPNFESLLATVGKPD